MALTESDSVRGVQSRLSPAALIARAKTWLADRSHTSIAQKMAGTAFLIRVASAALIYATQILFARWMGDFQFGIYVSVWAWVMLIGDISDLGLATAAQRFVPEYTRRKAFDLLRGFLSRSRWLALASATTIAICGALAIRLLEPWLASYLVLPLSIACVTLPFYSLMQMQDGIARSYNWVNLALLPMYVVRHAIMATLVLAAILFDLPTDAVTAVTASGIAIFVTALGQTLMLNRRIAREVPPGPKATEVRTWYATALPILMVEGFYLWLTNTDILLLQQFRGPEDVAVYFAAAKTLTLVAFVYFAVSAAVAHRFTEYHVAGDRERLAQFMRDAVRWTFWPSLAATVAMLVVGRFLLSLFGPRFVEGYSLMFILAVGLLARSSVGPAERLLSMLGEQRACAMVYASAFALNFVLCIVLIPRLGLEGAAISTAIALVIESVLLFWVAKARLGLHVFIIGPRTAR